MDGTSIYHYNPETNRQSNEKTEKEENPPRRPKRQQSTGNFMISVFWNTRGMIFIGNLEKQKNINREY